MKKQPARGRPPDHPIARFDHPITRSPDHPIRAKLLSWFKAQNRDLPWRRSKDPYRIWVSEVMLQQTTVGAVLPRYEPFLDRFPDVASLAAAPEESVVAEWSGLGYYSRARHLHRAARVVVRDHGGRMPSDPDVLRELPGFGEYMAAAVASLAFGVRAAAADANVTRVISRLHAIGGSPSSREHRHLVREAAAALLPDVDPGDSTAALMDLGQAICLPRRPRCGICPLAGECRALAGGDPAKYPERRALPPMSRVFYAAAIVERGGRLWLARRPAGTWLAGTWAFPAAEGASAAAARGTLARELRASGLRLGRTRPIGRADHVIMRRRFEIAVFSAHERSDPRAPEPSGARWFTARQLDRAAVSTLTRKIARAAGFLPAPD